MPVLTHLDPAEVAVWYAAGALAWGFILGLIGDRDAFLPTLGKILIWPISAAVTLGAILRAMFS